MVHRHDPATWSAVRRGDEEAFRALFAEHHNAVYNFAFRHAASWAVAEDATQACFTTVWRKARDGSLPDLRDGEPRAWLCAVARNECRNLQRSATRQLRVVGAIHPEGPQDNTSDWLDHEVAMGRINSVLAGLPDAQRAVVELVAWSGLGMAEVAAALHVPVGTVKSRLSRARQSLATSEVAHLLGRDDA